MLHATYDRKLRALIVVLFAQLVSVGPAIACDNSMQVGNSRYEGIIGFVITVLGVTAPFWSGTLIIRPLWRKWRLSKGLLVGLGLIASSAITGLIFLLAALIALFSTETALQNYLDLPPLLRHSIFALTVIGLFFTLSKYFGAWFQKFKVGSYSRAQAIISLYFAPLWIGMLLYSLFINIMSWFAYAH